MEKLSQQKIKDFKKLQLKKHRNAEQLLYLEGETLIKDLLGEFPQLVQTLIVTEDKLSDFENCNKELLEASFTDLEKLTQLKTPKKVNAIVKYPKTKPWKAGQKALLLDQIQDPGNLGTIIRTADWFGIQHIFCAPGTTDYLSPKVIHASMSSAFRVQLHYQELGPMIKKYADQTYGTFMDGADFEQIDPNQMQFLVLGHEGHGISDQLTSLLKHRIGIPQKGAAESLNVAVAAGILLQHLSK
ncbi:MAG: RNA methyltransferase [Crocinitomicaceae bacterium]|nr:RNA methyltransferase [Crocinitomicaceae bacterium]MDP4724391.1 RNA methyltransferase [Crocinitomicaceae bacterium]MDP4738782.1 RNA methyltransferase [Crocinitomicaceae bacterium]MDP4799125.1 RNA methyltransferase [Crocinitomicaceae bacterium]MDP4805707.1 RNA methyltransferase [Crocinitomicaceae bacterium]